MINLKNDYCGIAHKEIMDEYAKYGSSSFVGYGTDEMSNLAKAKIKKYFSIPNADIYFTIGGTSTNKIVIANALKPYEAVIACDTGHINVHETGAIEETGHKVLTTPNRNGKIVASDIISVVKKHTDCHMVLPRMVYISNPTEYGTLYTIEELKQIRKICDEYNLYLYIDGARLGAALGSAYNDISKEDYGKYADCFYIGGTKTGLPIGEAVCILNDNLKANFSYSIKHFGGMLAKGFLLGIAFNKMFEGNLYLEIGKKEDELAAKLQNGLINLGVEFLFESPTNQIFPVFTNEVVIKLSNDIYFEVWEERATTKVIRFVTSYLTTEEDVEKVLNLVKSAL